MRVWIRFKKESMLRFLSHLDLMRAWQRAIRRARMPVAYSAGFNPHPKMSFASALAVGVTSDAEYLDILFSEPIQDQDFSRLAGALPEGLTITEIREVPPEAPALMSLVRAAKWILPVKPEANHTLQTEIGRVLSSATLPVEREGKKGTKSVDIRPFIYRLNLNEDTSQLEMLLASGGDGGVKPREVMALLRVDSPENKLHRAQLYLGVGNLLQAPMHVVLRQKEVSVNAEEDCYQL